MHLDEKFRRTFCRTGIDIERAAETRRETDVRELHLVFMEPFLLERRAETDKENFRIRGIDFVDDGVVFRAGFFKVAVACSRDLQSGKFGAELFRGGVGDTGPAAEEKNGFPHIGGHGKDVFPEFHARHLSAQRRSQNPRSHDDARTVGQDDLGGVDDFGKGGVLDTHLRDFRIRRDDGGDAPACQCTFGKQKGAVHIHIVETNTAYRDFLHEKLSFPG